MKGDLPAAAFRLLTALPVRTHTQFVPQQRAALRRYLKRAAPAIGTARPVRYKGRTYASITEAKRKIRCSPSTLYHMLDTGKASYV